MLFDLLDRTLELPIKSEIVTQPYVDFLAHQYRLSHNGFHGIEHWLRVLINGRLIASRAGADIEVVEHFALLHDVMREDEDTDIQRGNRAAAFVKLVAGDWVHLNPDQLDQLVEACRYHSMRRLTHDVTIQTFWDADRLDLGRVGKRPHPTYLDTNVAREPSFLEAAYKRSTQRFSKQTYAR